jgi:hypothetical protein
MRLRKATLSPLLRSLAGLALLVFIAAQAMCFIHCHFGRGHGKSVGQPSCHGSARAKPTPGDRDTPAPTPTTTCSTLKNMLAGADSPTVVAPQLHTLYTLVSFSLSLDVTARAPHPPIFRRARSADRVFTPEVSLGPAFRSLAPPFLS